MGVMSPLRVLVVDESDDAGIAMAFLLRRFGHEAIVTHGGEVTLRRAPSFRPDVMFIDLAMRQFDALSLLRQVRQTREFAATPLVAVSRLGDAEHRAELTEAGFTEILAKPYPLSALEATLARLRGRIGAGRSQDQTSRAAAAAERPLLAEQSQQGLDESLPQRRWVTVKVQKSGISNMLSTALRPDADELRQWLKDRRCRVGPVFEPVTDVFGFFVYSKRFGIRELIASHDGYRVLR